MDVCEIIIYIVTLVFVIPLVILVNRKLYIKIKNEEHLEKGKVIQHIIKTYTLVQCVIWPVTVVAYGSIKLIGHFSALASLKTAVSLFRFLYTLFRDYLQLHSLIIAIARYIFLVHDSAAERFGIPRIRKYFINASFAIPCFTAILYELTCPIEKTYLYWFYDKWIENIQNNTSTDLDENDWETCN